MATSAMHQFSTTLTDVTRWAGSATRGGKKGGLPAGRSGGVRGRDQGAPAWRRPGRGDADPPPAAPPAGDGRGDVRHGGGAHGGAAGGSAWAGDPGHHQPARRRRGAPDTPASQHQSSSTTDGDNAMPSSAASLSDQFCQSRSPRSGARGRCGDARPLPACGSRVRVGVGSRQAPAAPSPCPSPPFRGRGDGVTTRVPSPACGSRVRVRVGSRQGARGRCGDTRSPLPLAGEGQGGVAAGGEGTVW
jgi:hypothetical protein